MSSCATTPTTMVVSSTRPIAVSERARAYVLSAPQVREERRDVEQRRQEDHEHELGVELDVRDAGQVPERDRPEHEHDRIGHADEPRDHAQCRDRDTESEDQHLGLVHVGPRVRGRVHYGLGSRWPPRPPG